MLSRAFTKPKRSPKFHYADQYSNRSSEPSINYEYEVGFMEDMSLVTCGHERHVGACGAAACGTQQLTMTEVHRSSVGVMGESGFGLTEKVVLNRGRVCAVKRFGKVAVRRREFGRRVERFAEVSRKCDRLVPVTNYLYAKRIKFVLCDYFPMGSLADLLAGGREQGHTALNWKQSLTIILQIARALQFIHTHSPSREKNMKLNVHGNVKASNVMIGVDFSARLSGYGFSQLAHRLNVSGEPPLRPHDNNAYHYQYHTCQETDIYNFGVIVLDVLGGSDASFLDKCMKGRTSLEEVKMVICVEGKVERKQAMEVLDVAWACVGTSPEARPNIEKVMSLLGDVCVYN